MNTINQLIDYVYGNQGYSVRKHVFEQLVRTPDNNKGHFWETCLAKAMSPHTKLIGGNNKGYDFEPCKSDAKIATFYKKSDGSYEASVGIENKIGPLRVCIVVPGHEIHRVFYLLIPHKAYKPYQEKSQCIKIHMNNNWVITDKWRKYVCKWEDITKFLGAHNP